MKLKSQTENCQIYNAFQGAIGQTTGLVANTFRKALASYMMDYYTHKLDELLGQYVKNHYARPCIEILSQREWKAWKVGDQIRQ